MISKEEYQARRQRLSALMPAGCLAIIPGNTLSVRNNDAHYRFRQDSDFYYLTGFEEPDAVLVLEAGKNAQSYLFNLPRDMAKEQWNGRRLGQERAADVLGISRAFSIEVFSQELQALMADKKSIYWSIGRYPDIDRICWQSVQALKEKVRRGVVAPETFVDVSPMIAEMRLFKSEAELALMRKAASISVEAHKSAMRECSSVHYEYELEAVLTYAFAKNGCRAPAYDPIVGGGANTCILHYTENNQPLKAGDLVLIDAGGEFQNYAADITRTFPVNGRFSEAQRLIYELVLKAQRAGIATVKPGVFWHEIQAVMVNIITEGLCALGILKGNVAELVEQEAYKPFYMHNSGHWLGLDVHDAGQYKFNNEWRALEPGMVLTVEPGIYIAEGVSSDKRWWNIGIRIEDDIAVTKNGHENLTGALPVEIDEIEALICGKASS